MSDTTQKKLDGTRGLVTPPPPTPKPSVEPSRHDKMGRITSPPPTPSKTTKKP